MKSTTSLLLLCCLVFPATVLAASDRYEMEMVIFAQPDAQDERLADERPNAERIAGSLAQGGPGVEPLAVREGQLVPAAYTLGRKGAKVLAHLRWQHDFAVSGSDGWMQVLGQNLQGAVRLRKGRYIHVFTDLQPADSDYPVREHGRLRSGELYYIDHPRIGILVRAERLDPLKPEVPSKRPEQNEEAPPAPPANDDNPPEEREPAGEIPRALPDNS